NRVGLAPLIDRERSLAKIAARLLQRRHHVGEELALLVIRFVQVYPADLAALGQQALAPLTEQCRLPKSAWRLEQEKAAISLFIQAIDQARSFDKLVSI